MDHILVVEDSRAMQRALRRIFEEDAMEVRVANDGLEAIQLFKDRTPSAVILDLKLPGRSGKELCRDFKSLASHVPILVVSANSEVEDKVLLLELGADDYVTKPFSPKELLARVRRAMRRGEAAEVAPSKQTAVEQEKQNHQVLRFDDVVVNFTTMEAAKGGRQLSMTAQEFKVLKFFAKAPGRVISREELLNEVWGYQNYPSTRTVDNHILRLRQKLEDDPSSPTHFLTVHGAGYKFLLVERSTALSNQA